MSCELIIVLQITTSLKRDEHLVLKNLLEIIKETIIKIQCS